ncbi:Ferredoxin reductase [Streptomyces formicae]|uniref:Ferredoxin reductase n=1 Tax=Streptomyces formicae TaxID=1616117 RepID=A0A291QJA5_9ACTN|nr:Ferredoxin reductase [Streptomyces formicae]
MARLGWSSASGEGDCDVSVLLLRENGKVGGNDDFYFYNHPVAADGSVQVLGQTPTDNGSEDRIRLDLSALPAAVERVVIAASRYRRAGFGELQDLRLTLTGASGEDLVGFALVGATVESAVVFAEIYRRAGEWKFRAIGQGYETGLAGLATDYGIEIDEDDDQDVPPQSASAAEAAEPGEAAEVAETASTDAPQELSAPAAPVLALPTPSPSPPAPQPRRLRTAKKKTKLPKAPAKPSLAENDEWRPARLFPLSSLKSDKDREVRATSILLSVMAQVPEFGRRLTAAFGAPAGRMETFTEVVLPNSDRPRRPDGIIRVERAGRLWTALVETKTNGNPLRAEQVRDYLDIAVRRGYEAVITLSNDVALDGSPLVEVNPDARRKNKVALWHLSWADVTHQAQMLIHHEGVRQEPHAWLLQELLHYLQHENSGCHGFQNMGADWVSVRNGIDDETLVPGDPRAVRVVESWERLIRQVCLRLGGELGEKVVPVQRAKRGTDPQSRRTALAKSLCEDGRLHAEIKIDGAPGPLHLTADLRLSRLRMSIEVRAADQGYPLTWVKRLMKQLAAAPADLHVETLMRGEVPGPRGTLDKLRPEPADLLPGSGRGFSGEITGFRLSLSRTLGSTRGNAASGFIRSVDSAIDVFHRGVITNVS